MGIKENQNSQQHLLLFPNPTGESVQVAFSLTQSQNISIEMYDASGKVVYSRTKLLSGDTKELIDVKDLPKGAYVVKVSGKEISETKKIIIE